MADGSQVTSGDICAALKLRYQAQSHALLFEVANGTGGHGRVFADALAFGLWPSHGHTVEGIEVKVSRSDFLAEMAKPEKSQPVFQYCDRWWLATPKGLVDPGEVPDTWGILEFKSGRLVTRKKAPKLQPAPMPRTFVASLLRRHAGADEETARVLVAREVESQMKTARERLQREYQQRHANAIAEAERANKAWQEILDTTGIDLRDYRHANGSLCEAVKLVQALNSGWDCRLDSLRSGAAKLIKTIDESGLLAKGQDHG